MLFERPKHTYMRHATRCTTGKRQAYARASFFFSRTLWGHIKPIAQVSAADLKASPLLTMKRRA
jgi:hypothetical protein